jgi:hypothetical protein
VARVCAVGPLSPRHEAAGELVDDDDLVALDDVFLVEAIEVVCAEGLVNQVRPVHVSGDVEAARADEFLGPAGAFLGHRALVFFLLDQEVALGLELPRHGVGLDVLVGRLEGGAGDDERGAGLVNQDRVALVDDRVGQFSLHLLAPRDFHVVAQVIEAELVVGAVGDVAGVLGLALLAVHVGLDGADRQAQPPEDRAVPVAVAADEVVVDADDVDLVPRQGVQVRRQRGHQRLAFAGREFGDAAVVQDHRPYDLHVVRAHAVEAEEVDRLAGRGVDEAGLAAHRLADAVLNLRVIIGRGLFVAEPDSALGGLACGREGLRQDGVEDGAQALAVVGLHLRVGECLAAGELLVELGNGGADAAAHLAGLVEELLVGEALHLEFQDVDQRHFLAIGADQALVTRSEDHCRGLADIFGYDFQTHRFLAVDAQRRPRSPRGVQGKVYRTCAPASM